MTNVFAILMVLAMLAVLGVLGIGLVAMARGGEFGRRHGNRMMRWRVFLQGLALVLFVLALLASGRG